MLLCVCATNESKWTQPDVRLQRKYHLGACKWQPAMRERISIKPASERGKKTLSLLNFILSNSVWSVSNAPLRVRPARKTLKRKLRDSIKIVGFQNCIPDAFITWMEWRILYTQLLFHLSVWWPKMHRFRINLSYRKSISLVEKLVSLICFSQSQVKQARIRSCFLLLWKNSQSSV